MGTDGKDYVRMGATTSCSGGSLVPTKTKKEEAASHAPTSHAPAIQISATAPTDGRGSWGGPGRVAFARSGKKREFFIII